MPDEKKQPTLADYFVLAIAPALIMALVISLVFFLVEVLHGGQHRGRLEWILFFFVFGAVLIARVSMMGEIAGRAGAYGFFLGLAVWLGISAYVEYPQDNPLRSFGWLINLGLIGLVWWSAHRLTWDCTYNDEEVGAEGQGVLQAAGLGQTGAAAAASEGPGPANAKPSRGFVGWWERYDRYRREKAKKRTPGVWVIFFSLAALPLFGLGQSLIPTEEENRRRYAFWLMIVYVGSGLGLLLTTAFLGLRRYLRRRNVAMPVHIAGLWLALGLGLIAFLLVGGSMLPRPRAEYPLFELSQLGLGKKKASQHDILGGKAGEGKGRPVQPEPGDDEEKKQPMDPNQADGKEGGAKKTEGQSKKKGASKRDPNAKGRGDDGDKDPAQRDERGEPKAMPNEAEPPPWLATLLKILKWIVFAILALVVAVIVVRAILQFLANFTKWARSILEFFSRLWQSLLGRGGSQKNHAQEDAVTPAAPPRPFASYQNPFADGSANRRSVHDLIRYTFEALEAFARDHGEGRPLDETPFEFTERLGYEHGMMRDDLRRLAILHARATYAVGPLPPTTRDVLEQCWRRMEEAVVQPV